VSDDPTKGRQPALGVEEKRASEREIESIRRNVDELYHIVSKFTDKFEDVALRLDQSRSDAKEGAKETTGEFKAVAASAAGAAARLDRLEHDVEGPPAPRCEPSREPPIRRGFSVTKRTSDMAEHDPTAVSLKEFLMARVEEINYKLQLHANHLHEQLIFRSEILEKQLDEKASTIEKSTSLASRSMEARLESMNEFRAQLKNQATEFMRREECLATMGKCDADIRTLNRSKDLLEGKATMLSVYISYGLSIIALAMALIKMFK